MFYNNSVFFFLFNLNNSKKFIPLEYSKKILSIIYSQKMDIFFKADTLISITYSFKITLNGFLVPFVAKCLISSTIYNVKVWFYCN